MARGSSRVEAELLAHLDAAHNLARWLLGDKAAAADAVQDAMLRALRHQAGLRGETKPWLLRIVRNAAYTAMEQRRRLAEVPLESCAEVADAAAADDPHAALERQEQLRSLDQRLAALPVDLRECLVLRELEELSYKEIATVTGVPIGTVMSRLWRARQALLAERR